MIIKRLIGKSNSSSNLFRPADGLTLHVIPITKVIIFWCKR